MNAQENRPRKVLQDNPVTLSEVDHVLNERIEIIENEFRNGFNLIKNCDKTVTFFGSARTLENESDYQKTLSLASRISKELGYAIFSGGGPGIMEASNRGAFEAHGKSVGLTIRLPQEQTTNPYLTDHFDFTYFFSRKVCMSFSAEAYVFLPGGYGTLDELFEILTLVQTRKIENVPIILFGNTTFWKNLDSFIRENLLTGEKIDLQDLDLYTITDNEDEVLELIRKAPVRTIIEE